MRAWNDENLFAGGRLSKTRARRALGHRGRESPRRHAVGEVAPGRRRAPPGLRGEGLLGGFRRVSSRARSNAARGVSDRHDRLAAALRGGGNRRRGTSAAAGRKTPKTARNPRSPGRVRASGGGRRRARRESARLFGAGPALFRRGAAREARGRRGRRMRRPLRAAVPPVRARRAARGGVSLSPRLLLGRVVLRRGVRRRRGGVVAPRPLRASRPDERVGARPVGGSGPLRLHRFEAVRGETSSVVGEGAASSAALDVRAADLGFYGVAGGSDYNTFDELYLTMSDGSILDHTNDATEVETITLLKATWGGENNTETIFNGTNSYTSPYLTFHKPNPPGSSPNAIYFYFKVNTNKDPTNGTFYTRTAGGQNFASGKLYGTNTDPSTLANDLERMDISVLS